MSWQKTFSENNKKYEKCKNCEELRTIDFGGVCCLVCNDDPETCRRCNDK